jgi:hypothetical protein
MPLGASAVHFSFGRFMPMSGSEIPPIGPLRYLLFENLNEKNFTGGNGGALR